MATDFLKAVKPEVEEFKYALPEMLKKAVRKHHGMTLLEKPYYKGSTTKEYYLLKRGKVEHYFASLELRPKPFEKYSYENFANSLSAEDALIVAKNLSELGL